MTIPRASVIVRALNEGHAIGRTIDSLRRQTVEPEIILVDSGSTDATLRIAAPRCDQVIELEPGRFSYGRALNLGANASRAPIHFALSAHCWPAREDWIERSLELYLRSDVAATGGMLRLPSGREARNTLYQRSADARAHPAWGFSNHASSWRADIWQRFPFNERLEATEDKEWAWRVLHEGWVIAYDPALWVDMSHQWQVGIRASYQRQKREARGLRCFAPLPDYRARDLVREWWCEMPIERSRPAWAHRFMNVRRHARLLGKYHGMRQG